jgi:hypothetical protein
MSDVFNLGEILEEAKALDAPAPVAGDSVPAPVDPPAGSLPPPGEPAATTDALQEPSQAQGDTSAYTGANADAAEGNTDESTDEGKTPNPRFEELRTHAKSLERQLKDSNAVLEDLGGADTVRAIASPLLAADFSPSAVRDVIKEQRGDAAYSSLAWSFFGEHSDDYLSAILSHPEALKSPEQQARVKAFLEFERTGGAQAPVTREQTNAQPDTSGFFDGDDDLDLEALPESARRLIESLQAKQNATDQRLDDLKRLQEEERQRIEAENKARQEETIAKRTADLTREVTAVLDSNVQPLKFSTEIDPKLRDEENAVFRKEIMTLIVAELDHNPEASDLYAKAHGKYAKGDRIGARADVKRLKELFNATAQRHVQNYSKRFSGQRASEAPTVETRKVITGTGVAPTLTEPTTQPGGNIWDIGNTLREANARLG